VLLPYNKVIETAGVSASWPVDSISVPLSLERISHLLLSVIVIGADVFVFEKSKQVFSVPL
jgi:hypothetical protein